MDFMKIEKSIEREREERRVHLAKRTAVLAASDNPQDRLVAFTQAAWWGSFETFLAAYRPAWDDSAWGLHGVESSSATAAFLAWHGEEVRASLEFSDVWFDVGEHFRVRLSRGSLNTAGGRARWTWHLTETGAKKLRRRVEDRLRKGGNGDILKAAALLDV